MRRQSGRNSLRLNLRTRRTARRLRRRLIPSHRPWLRKVNIELRRPADLNPLPLSTPKSVLPSRRHRTRRLHRSEPNPRVLLPSRNVRSRNAPHRISRRHAQRHSIQPRRGLRLNIHNSSRTNRNQRSAIRTSSGLR